MHSHLKYYDLPPINTAPSTQAAQPITAIAGLLLNKEGYQQHFPSILRLCKVELPQSPLHKPSHSRTSNTSPRNNTDQEQYNIDIQTDQKFPEEDSILTGGKQKRFTCNVRLAKPQSFDKYLQKDTFLEIKEQLKIAHQLGHCPSCHKH